MYTGVPHFDLKMLEADIILLNPKSVICTNSGVNYMLQHESRHSPQTLALDRGSSLTLILVSLSFSQRIFSGFRSLRHIRTR